LSWEVTSEWEVAKCPCGKGALVRTNESNDWFQHSESSRITCADCAGRYRYISGRWMTPEEVVAHKAEVAERERRAFEEDEKRIETLRQEFREPLLAALADLRSRKAVYERLGKIMPVVGSFYSFNRHWQEGGRERAILSAVWVEQNTKALRKRFKGRPR
jgi:hypothetical protein